MSAELSSAMAASIAKSSREQLTSSCVTQATRVSWLDIVQLRMVIPFITQLSDMTAEYRPNL